MVSAGPPDSKRDLNLGSLASHSMGLDSAVDTKTRMSSMLRTCVDDRVTR